MCRTLRYGQSPQWVLRKVSKYGRFSENGEKQWQLQKRLTLPRVERVDQNSEGCKEGGEFTLKKKSEQLISRKEHSCKNN